MYDKNKKNKRQNNNKVKRARVHTHTHTHTLTNTHTHRETPIIINRQINKLINKKETDDKKEEKNSVWVGRVEPKSR